MTLTRPHPVNRGFSLIEALLMIVTLLVFSIVVYAVIKKDYLQPQQPAAHTPAPAADQAAPKEKP
jgi:Tfp pilus assembly protein PilV